MTAHLEPEQGIAAGVPFLAVPPISTPTPESPVVVAWHLMDPPRTEAAFAAAIPLEGLDAWRIYLGLPMCGSRLPEGGQDELMRLAFEDAVMNVQGPIAQQGALEFPAAFRVLQERFGFGAGSLALAGGSMGSAVAQLVLAQTGPVAGITAKAGVLISPVAQLRPVVDAVGRRYDMTYPWGPASLEVAQGLDFVARAGETVAAGQPALRIIVGAADDAEGFLVPCERLLVALRAGYDDPAQVELVVVPGMAHALAEEPGIEPAPQTPNAAVVDRYATDWLRTHLLD